MNGFALDILQAVVGPDRMRMKGLGDWVSPSLKVHDAATFSVMAMRGEPSVPAVGSEGV